MEADGHGTDALGAREGNNSTPTGGNATNKRIAYRTGPVRALRGCR